MFDLVRKHTKILMFMMFLLIIPAFVLVGIDGYKRFNDGATAVARVGGRDISQAELDFAHKSEVERIRASMPSIDAKLLDSPQARYASRLITSDARLARDLQQNPTIAALRRPDGGLDMDRYKLLVASQGLTPEGFEARVRRDLSLRQVEAAIMATGFSVPAVAEVSLGSFFEKREVQIVNFKSADFVSRLNPSDAEIEAFYKGNAMQFQAPESVSIEYLVLDLDTIKKSISISESDLKAYYEQNAARLSGAEERRASHILISAAKDAASAEREKAKKRAQDLLAEVKKSPTAFAEIAKKHSQDPGSAPSGGDLNFFARGAMVKVFEDAAFAMKTGDISEVVESDFGYHIIKLTDVKMPKQRSFDELRAKIEADLKAQQAQRKFAETAEAFTNGVYEQADSLKPVAEKLKLEIKVANNLLRRPAPGTTGVLANAKLLGALFGDDAIVKKRNTEAVETAPNQLVSARVVMHTPARTLPLAEVRSAVRERLLISQAADMARKDGLAKLAAWKALPGDPAAPMALVVSRDQAQGVPPKVVEAAMRTDPSALPALSGVDLGDQGYAVVKVGRIVSRSAPDDAAGKQARGQYAQLWSAAENQAYYGVLKDRFKARVNLPVPTNSLSEGLPASSQ